MFQIEIFNFRIDLGTIQCLENQFTCSNKVCISSSQLCNGFNDCGDNIDEIDACIGRNINS